jgi:hypothetical protein
MSLCTLARTFSYVKNSLPQDSGNRNNANKSIYAPLVDHFIFSLVVERYVVIHFKLPLYFHIFIVSCRIVLAQVFFRLLPIST